MYTSFGDGIILKNKDIIAIFDVGTIKASNQNRRLKYIMDKKKFDGKSIVLIDTEDETQENVFSNISVSTLKKRIEKGLF